MKLSMVTRSKWQFPTRVKRQSKDKGMLIRGDQEAIKSIERQMGHKLEVVKTRHTPTQWRFYFKPRKRVRKEKHEETVESSTSV